MLYGRDEADWERLTSAGLEFLQERARMGRLSSYTELNQVLVQRTGLRAFDFGLDGERAMGQLLGGISEISNRESGVLISALVPYLNENWPGPGFYELAVRLDAMRRGYSHPARP
jgi:hypothetical protein